MQGGHTVLPGVSRVASMGRALEGVSGRTDVARVYLDADASVYTVAGSRKDYPSVAIAVGPERGFTDGEKEALTQAGFRAIRLPAGILRTESAAIAGVAVVCACLATA